MALQTGPSTNSILTGSNGEQSQASQGGSVGVLKLRAQQSINNSVSECPAQCLSLQERKYFIIQ